MVRVFEEGRMSSVKYLQAVIRKTLKGRLWAVGMTYSVTDCANDAAVVRLNSPADRHREPMRNRFVN